MHVKTQNMVMHMVTCHYMSYIMQMIFIWLLYMKITMYNTAVHPAQHNAVCIV